LGVKLLLLGDCQARLRELADNSVDSIVTDPPYGLSFMGKKWDYDVPSVDIWREALRVLKPGGHLLAFGGTRTYHRLVVAIEDAGFEIRDQVQWIYGQGFPKSLDISKAIDKAAGIEREVVGRYKSPEAPTRLNTTSSEAMFHSKQLADAELTAPSTDAAKQWSGWGTALKPANEPICLARKPLEKGLTIAQNVQRWGTGGLNIDASRIGAESIPRKAHDGDKYAGFKGNTQGEYKGIVGYSQGRFPANVILDEAAGEMLDEQTGFLAPSGNKRPSKGDAIFGSAVETRTIPGVNSYSHEGGGGASRFFYCAKASTSERNAGCEGMPKKAPVGEYGLTGDTGNPQQTPHKHEARANFHPTVKPIKLMEYLIKLITPPGGIVLDPFMGSGTTGVAARRLGINFTGIELNPEYFEIARARIENGYREREDLPVQSDLETYLDEVR